MIESITGIPLSAWLTASGIILVLLLTYVVGRSIYVWIKTDFCIDKEIKTLCESEIEFQSEWVYSNCFTMTCDYRISKERYTIYQAIRKGNINSFMNVLKLLVYDHREYIPWMMVYCLYRTSQENRKLTNEEKRIIRNEFLKYVHGGSKKPVQFSIYEYSILVYYIKPMFVFSSWYSFYIRFCVAKNCELDFFGDRANRSNMFFVFCYLGFLELITWP